MFALKEPVPIAGQRTLGFKVPKSVFLLSDTARCFMTDQGKVASRADLSILPIKAWHLIR